MEADVCLPGHMLQADMGGWTSNSLSTRLPQPLLRWSALWHSVIRPVVHHNLMLRNRVPPPALTPVQWQHCAVLPQACLHEVCALLQHWKSAAGVDDRPDMAMGKGSSAKWRSHLWWECTLRHFVRPFLL